MSDCPLGNNRKALVSILALHIVLMMVAAATLLYLVFAGVGYAMGPCRVIVYSGILSFLGSIIYFSRKCYVYLITGKLEREVARIRNEEADDDRYAKRAASAVTGYYAYLLFRPAAGALIGPVLYMLAVSGLATFAGKSIQPDAGISQAGRYLIYTISFLGGHAASEIFDYFTWLAKSAVAKRKKTAGEE